MSRAPPVACPSSHHPPTGDKVSGSQWSAPSVAGGFGAKPRGRGHPHRPAPYTGGCVSRCFCVTSHCKLSMGFLVTTLTELLLWCTILQ
eukprot:jgi/Botrbrau1/15166/Bobra.0149s0031.1